MKLQGTRRSFVIQSLRVGEPLCTHAQEIRSASEASLALGFGIQGLGFHDSGFTA